MRITPSLVPFAFAALSAAPAYADRSDPVTAEALFRAGREAVDRGDYASACPKFEESNRLDPAVGTTFNLAACDEQIGKIASAWQLFREVAQRLPPGDERIAIARSRAAALEPKLPRLTLQMPSAPAGAVVLRDEVELGRASLGVPLPVDPGDHVVVVKSPGRGDRRFDVTLSAGATRELVLEPGPPVEETKAISVAPANTEHGGSSRTLGFVGLGVGGAGVVASLALGAVALSSKHIVDSECKAGYCTQKGLDAADRGRTAATVSTVAFTVGVVAAAAGTYLVLTGGEPRREAASPPPVTVGVSPMRGGAFVAALGRLP
jgi:hypothetical protein